MARKTGAIFVNPKPKRRRKLRVGGSALRKLLGGGSKRRRSRRKRNASSSKRRTVRRVVRRASTRRRVIRRRRNGARTRRARAKAPKIYRNGVRRRSRRLRSRSRRRNGFRNRRTSARRSSRRRNGFSKIPVVGGVLSSLFSFTPGAIAGAAGVEPTLAVAQMIARFWPTLPTAFLYPLAGMTMAVVFEKFGGIVIKDDRLRREIAVAFAAGGAAVGYYKKRTNQDRPAAAEMGALIAAGMGSPVANALMGQRGMAGLMYAGQHMAGLQYASPVAVRRY